VSVDALPSVVLPVVVRTSAVTVPVNVGLALGALSVFSWAMKA
jgi:hypothetical protein